MYKYYNANEGGKFVNDCVVRSIATAENQTWSDTYDDLSRIAKNNNILLDDVNFVEPLLDYRYKRVYPEHCNAVIPVAEFIDRYPKGTYLITMSGHITVVIDGVLYDTFDCRNRLLLDAWKVK